MTKETIFPLSTGIVASTVMRSLKALAEKAPVIGVAIGVSEALPPRLRAKPKIALAYLTAVAVDFALAPTRLTS
jgi:hypothetical protein